MNRNIKEKKEYQRNRSNGITLIALVVTIIILLILAGVALTAMINGGIFDKAKEATTKTQIGKEKEQIATSYAKYKMESAQGIGTTLTVDGASVTGSDTEGWTITFDDTGNTYKIHPDGKVEETGKVENPPLEPPAEPTDIYVTLYSDGTLGFSNSEEKIVGKVESKSYGNIKGQTFNTGSKATPWHADVESITTVEIQDEIVPTETAYWFLDCRKVTKINNISNLNTSLVTTMDEMFYNCSSLDELDLSSFDTKNVKIMFAMFHGCTNLTKLSISKFDTRSLTNMSYMFEMCSSLTKLNISNFDTSKVTNMTSVFNGCSSLMELDVSNFDTSNVTMMGGMFSNCSNLKELDLSNFKTSNVNDMNHMFQFCTNLKIVYARKDRWITENVTNITEMWRSCGTNHITYKTYLENNKVVGYEITKGYGWRDNGATKVRVEDNRRASCLYFIQLDPEKQYKIEMKNSNYDFGYSKVDIDLKTLFDSGWQTPDKTPIITDTEYMLVSFGYHQSYETQITDEMLNEIIEAFEITLVD